MTLLDRLGKRRDLPTVSEALPGRDFELPTAQTHFVNGTPLKGPYPDGSEIALFGLGCFWGAERLFWRFPGVITTMVGYSGGSTPNPTYQEVCTGLTGHNEVVRVVFDPKVISYAELLGLFFESHDPTQGMRQGNDVGTQYRSGAYYFNEAQRAVAETVKTDYAAALAAVGRPATVTTEIQPAAPFYFAEDYHQQYLAKNPKGYCGLGGTGVTCPVPGVA